MVTMIVIADALKKRGFRVTAPRVSIFNVLQKASYPMSVQEVKMGTKGVDTVTVYRTLEAFKQAGLVVQVDLQRGHALYELKEGKSDHHHIVCMSCKKIEDFTGCDYQPIAQQALKKSKGFAKIISHSLELFGLCALCATK